MALLQYNLHRPASTRRFLTNYLIRPPSLELLAGTDAKRVNVGGSSVTAKGTGRGGDGSVVKSARERCSGERNNSGGAPPYLDLFPAAYTRLLSCGVRKLPP